MKDDSYYFLFVDLSIRVQQDFFGSEEFIYDEIEKFHINVDIENQKISFSNNKQYEIYFVWQDEIVSEEDFFRIAREKFQNKEIKFISGGSSIYKMS